MAYTRDYPNQVVYVVEVDGEDKYTPQYQKIAKIIEGTPWAQPKNTTKAHKYTPLTQTARIRPPYKWPLVVFFNIIRAWKQKKKRN